MDMQSKIRQLRVEQEEMIVQSKQIEAMSGGIKDYTKDLHNKKMSVQSEVLTKTMEVQKLQIEVQQANEWKEELEQAR